MSLTPEFIDLVVADADHPRSGEGDMVELTDGRLLFAYGAFRGGEDHAPADIVACYSSDHGQTWTQPQVLVENEGQCNVMSVSLLHLSPQRILLFYLRTDSTRRCYVCLRESTDEAQTWGPPAFCTPQDRYYVICNDCAIQLNDGRILLPYDVTDDASLPDEHQHIMAGAVYSDDGGQTWQMSNEIYSRVRGAMEPKVVELNDGRLWMLLRTDRGVLDESFSEDGGATWSEAVSSGIVASQAPFVFKRIPNTGDLLLIRNPEVNLQLSHQGYRTPLRCTISRDEGTTWEKAKDLEPDLSHTYCYVSLTFVEDMAILSYYVGTPRKPLESLRVARVPIDWFYT